MLGVFIGEGGTMEKFPENTLVIWVKLLVGGSSGRQVNMSKPSKRLAMLYNTSQNLSPSPLCTQDKLRQGASQEGKATKGINRNSVLSDFKTKLM
jgi:hypothetical protein